MSPLWCIRSWNTLEIKAIYVKLVKIESASREPWSQHSAAGGVFWLSSKQLHTECFSPTWMLHRYGRLWLGPPFTQDMKQPELVKSIHSHFYHLSIVVRRVCGQFQTACWNVLFLQKREWISNLGRMLMHKKLEQCTIRNGAHFLFSLSEHRTESQMVVDLGLHLQSSMLGCWVNHLLSLGGINCFYLYFE